MPTQGELLNARSWLFAPGDSDRKMAKATASPADIVIFDLEDAVAESEKPKARAIVPAFVKANTQHRSRFWVRINPLQGPHALLDLAAVVPAAPAGILLPKARARADVDVLHHYLTALEAANGIDIGATKVAVLATEEPAAMLAMGSFAGAPRLVALTWGAEDLATALGASDNKGDFGGYGFTYELARTLCLVGAAAAGVAAIDTIHGDFKDEEGLRKRVAAVRRAGYRGMLAIHPAQVDIINEGFMPTADEVARAQEIVDLFAANPGAGAIALRGAMLDLPYLSRANAVLAMAKRK